MRAVADRQVDCTGLERSPCPTIAELRAEVARLREHLAKTVRYHDGLFDGSTSWVEWTAHVEEIRRAS